MADNATVAMDLHQKLSRAFAKASLEALHLEACQKMRACVYLSIYLDRTAFAAQSHWQAQLVLPAAGGILLAARQQRAAQRRSQNLFLGGGCLGSALRPPGGLLGLKITPCFKGRKMTGRSAPSLSGGF
jgi:hypothetical protein